MKKRARWLLAVMLTVAMTLSCMPVASAAGSRTAKGNRTTNPWGINVDLSNVPGQVQEAVANMIAQGMEPMEKKTDAFLAEVVEDASGISFEAVKGSLGLELLQNDMGTFDTSRFNLGEEEFNRVMKEVLSEYFLTDLAYSCNVDDGIVTSIRFMPSYKATSFRDMFTASDLWDMYQEPLTASTMSASRAENYTLSEDEEENVPALLSVEDGDKPATGTLHYKVEYYKDGHPVGTDTESMEAPLEAGADTVTVNATDINTTNTKYDGFRFDHTEPELPAPVSEGDTIKVFYVTDKPATGTLHYKVEYYKDGHPVGTDTESMEAPLEAGADTVTVNATDINTSNTKYDGFRFDHTEPELPAPVSEGDTIKVFYVTDKPATGTLHYKVEYYKDGHPVGTDTESMEAPLEAGADTVTVNATDINTSNTKYDGFRFDHTEPELPAPVSEGDTIKVFYVTDDSETVTYTAKFNWAPDDQYVAPTDKEKAQGLYTTLEDGTEVAYTLVYDTENKKISTGLKTAIGFKLESVTLSADGYPSITLKEGDKGVDVQIVPMYSFYGYEFPSREIITEKFGMIDEKTKTSAGDVASEIKYYQVTYDGTGATYGGDVSDVAAPGRLDVTSRAEEIHWQQMLTFTRDYAQHFGAAGDFWTSKNTEDTPYGAFKTQLDSYPEDYMPDTIMDQYMELMTLAYMSYEQSYGSLLDQKIADCLAQLDDSMTPVQKYLVIHDWIANNAEFDMGVLVKTAAGTGNPDPAQMTAFGTLLSDAMGYDGCICLGYSATFAVLVQHAFPEIYKNADGTWKTASEVGDDDIVDLVQIRFYADLAEFSVAGADSGFGKADEMFGSVHYYNAVKVDQKNENGTSTPVWYCIDSAYDDITTEVMDQCRVETKGNISHKYFMISPVNMLGMFEDSMDYIDCLYDGVVFLRTPNMDEEGNVIVDANGNPYKTETDKYGNEHVYWTKYNVEDVGMTELECDDDQYEATWFSGAVGEITHDDNYWYYITGPSFSYANMMNMMNQMKDQGMDLGDLKDQMGSESNNSEKDRLVRRPRTAADEPEETEDEGGGTGGTGGMGDFANMSSYDDPYDQILFHFGYGSVLPDEEVLDNENISEDEKQGPYYDQVLLDETYYDMYPDLVHSMGMYDGVLYFNLGNKIYTMTGADKVTSAEEKLTLEDVAIAQLKEYNDVYAKTDGRDFTGMSFYAVSEADYNAEGAENNAFHVFNRPIAAICIEDEVSYKDQLVTDADGNPVGQVKVRDTVTPTLTVSIGTNFSESYKTEDGVKYELEAVDYNPDYSKYTDDGSDPDPDVNDNEEFMWCANVVDTMPMDAMLEELASEENTEDAEAVENASEGTEDDKYVTVTVRAWCGQDGYTEQRTKTYGLSDGTAKVTNENDLALNHHYIENEREDCYVCVHCNTSYHDEYTEDDDGYKPYDENATYEHYDYGEGETPEFVNIEWAADYSTCTAQLKCAERYCDAAISDTVDCTVKDETIDGSDGNAYRVCTATYMGNVVDKQYPNGKPAYTLGDVNDDGEIKLKDVVLLRQYYAGGDVTVNELAADVNGDGAVTLKDVVRLRQYYAGWDVQLGKSEDAE